MWSDIIMWSLTIRMERKGVSDPYTWLKTRPVPWVAACQGCSISFERFWQPWQITGISWIAWVNMDSYWFTSIGNNQSKPCTFRLLLSAWTGHCSNTWERSKFSRGCRSAEMLMMIMMNKCTCTIWNKILMWVVQKCVAQHKQRGADPARYRT